MSETVVVVFAGSTEHIGLSDLIPGPAVVHEVSRADGLVIRDPLAFPWEALGTNSPVPMVVDLSNASADDLVSLAPVLRSLTPSDVLLGDRATIEQFCAEHDLPNLWTADDLEISDHVASTRGTKVADIEEAAILRRLAETPDCVAVQVSGATIRHARTGFVELVQQLRRETPGLERATIHSIWGIRAAPGAPLDRAVLAFTTPAQAAPR